MNNDSQPGNEGPRSSAEAMFSAAQISIALRKSKRAVLLALNDVVPSGTCLSRGLVAKAWAVSALPGNMRAALFSEAKRRGYRNAEHMLETPPEKWMPPIPLNEVAPQYREKAAKLQRALENSIPRLNDLAIKSDDIERLGLDDYQRVFGHRISARQWRRLIERTLERDGGAEDFTRFELYLDDNAARALAPVDNLLVDLQDYIPLQSIIAGFETPLQPNKTEREYFWINVLEWFEQRLSGEHSKKRIKKKLLAFLNMKAPFLADNPKAMKWTFERKYRQWVKGSRQADAVVDRRSSQSGNYRAPELTEDDKKLILATALTSGGGLTQAWRKLFQGGQLSHQIMMHYAKNSASKSYVPRKIREALKYEVEMMGDIHHGPKRARLNGAYVERDPDTFFSGDWFQADDLTAPIYYYDQTEAGLSVVRSQVLAMVDVRTSYILGYVLTGTASYSAFHIRNLITSVHDDYGMPRRGFYFENGSWRSHLITGRKDELEWCQTEMGLRGLGLQFRHAKLARAKVVERVFGSVQDLMEGDLGYCGRDERRDHFERMENHKRLVEAGKVPPQEYFMSRQQWCARLEAIFNEYNNDAQDGKYLDGICPREAYEKFHGQEGLIKLPSDCRYLLSTHKMIVRVGRNGIVFRFGKQAYTYKNEMTGRFKGQSVVAWFNPEFPEVLSVSDEKMKHSFTVERCMPIPAMDATEEQLAEALSKNAQHDAYAKALYKTIRPQFSAQFMRRMFQPVAVDRRSEDLGRQMAAHKDAAIQEHAREAKRQTKVYREAQRLGLSSYGLNRDSKAADEGIDLMKQAYGMRENQHSEFRDVEMERKP